MLICSSKFSSFYIIFLLIGTCERIISTFFQKEIAPSKYIYYKWAFIIPLCSYIFIVFFSIGEYFLIVREVNLTVSLVGFIIFVAGVLIRRKSIATLGRNWSVYIEIKEGQELITYGIYKFLKHPYCLAVLLELIGISLIPNAFFSLILILLIQAPLLLIRIKLEEKILIDYFGNAYRKYSIGKLL